MYHSTSYLIDLYHTRLGYIYIYIRITAILYSSVKNAYYIVFVCTACSVLERLDELEYRRVQLHGHFDHSRELYVWPRTPIADDSPQRQGGGVLGGKGPQPGAFVITPFHCVETE